MKIFRRLEIAAVFAFLLIGAGLAVWGGIRSSGDQGIRTLSPAVIARLNAMPSQGWAPLLVSFSAWGSTAEGSANLRYEWDLDGNGLADYDATSSGGYARYLYSKPGTYTITLWVTDDQGRSSSDQIEISVRHPASSSVDYWSIFDDSKVQRIEMQLNQADWQRMWQNIEAKIEVPADAEIFGERLENVGFRMRGQFSLRVSGEKKPWKINTDAFVDGQEFRNLKMLVLLNNIGDSTLLREKLAYDMMQFAGVPVGFASFVELWIDIMDDDQPATFWGVYTLAERVDAKFLANRFGPDSKDGNLYKASHAQRGPMDLIYYGDRIEDYPTQNGAYAYGKMNNEEVADYSDVIGLCKLVDGTEYEDEMAYRGALEQAINVDSFLRYLAVVMILDNWDSYPFTGNNYYLFNNPVKGRFEWIPWDLSIGGNPQSPIIDLEGERLVERAPLFDQLLQINYYRTKYFAYIDLLTRYWFTEANIARLAGAYHNLIAPYVMQSTGDKMFAGDGVSFSVENFNDSWQELVEFARQRSAYLINFLAQQR